MKNTLISAVAIAILVLGVLFFRHSLLQSRDASGTRLEEIAVSLDEYAGKHNGILPIAKDELDEILSLDAVRYTGVVDLGIKGNYRWQGTNPLPYLWDREPHPFIGGYHVLYTDGEVVLENAPPDVGAE